MIVRKHTYHLYSIYIIYVLAERVDLEYYVIFLAFQSFKLVNINLCQTVY
jgi:hypothetical protein